MREPINFQALVGSCYIKFGELIELYYARVAKVNLCQISSRSSSLSADAKSCSHNKLCQKIGTQYINQQEVVKNLLAYLKIIGPSYERFQDNNFFSLQREVYIKLLQTPIFG